MKQTFKILFLILLALNLLAAFSYAAVPHLINYQGRLTDTAGKPLADGSYSITFRIYDAQTAGNMLWEEINPTVVIQKGIFSVLLGSVTNLNLAFDKPYYLEIKVGAEVMAPRQQIASVGYAIKAENADFLTVPAHQGDILYFNGTNWTNLEAGTPGQYLKTQGAGANPVWFDVPSIPKNMQAFTSSGTWKKPAGVTKVYVKVWGAGGDGSGGDSSISGGGGGGYAEGVINVSGDVTIIIASGGSGNTTSFAGSTTISATAGTNAGGTAGTGGSGSGGSINLTGGTGCSHIGRGGSCPFGGEGGMGATDGSFPGGGAGGADRYTGTGRGADGLVIVYY